MGSRVQSAWQAMKGHDLGVRLATDQLSNPSHFTSPNLSFHICEMGIISLSSKDSQEDKIKSFCFSSHRGASWAVATGNVCKAILNMGGQKGGSPTHPKHS